MNLTEPGYDFIGKSEAPILRALARTTSSMSGNQLIKVAGLKYNGGHVLTLRKLVKLGILLEDSRLAANYYTINREHILWPAIEIILHSGDNINDRIKEILQQAPILQTAVSVALFGSVARRESNADSDIDLIIIIPGTQKLTDEEYDQVEQATGRIRQLTGNIVNPITINEEELTLLITQGGSLVNSLRTDAITLLGEELKGKLSPSD